MLIKIKMKIRYRMSGFFAVCIAAALTLLVILAVAFIFADHNYGMAILCMAIGALILVAVWFRFNYGLTISEKRLVAIEQGGIKILRYDDISNITVKFTNDYISTHIKMKNGKEHIIVRDHIFLGADLILPSENKIRLYDKFVNL